MCQILEGPRRYVWGRETEAGGEGVERRVDGLHIMAWW